MPAGQSVTTIPPSANAAEVGFSRTGSMSIEAARAGEAASPARKQQTPSRLEHAQKVAGTLIDNPGFAATVELCAKDLAFLGKIGYNSRSALTWDSPVDVCQSATTPE
jgi:hypothetical protein